MESARRAFVVNPMYRTPFVRKVHQHLKRLGVGADRIVVAVSGGPDSVALLRTLIALRPSHPAETLTIAHLNHQLRGAESNADEDFVRDLYGKLRMAGVDDLELCCARSDVAGRARTEGGNVEAVARRVRYDWLTQVARETAASWVATGHTADDQAETVLHRLLRGTGLQGLRGIAAGRPLAPGVELVRPLLTVTRREVMAYLEAEGQAWCHDQSNDDPNFTRNRLRHHLLPLLASQYNPSIVSILGRLATQAGDAHAEDERRAQALLNNAELPRSGPLFVFDTLRLTAAPRHLVRTALRLVWSREGWAMSRMGFGDWDRAAGVVFGECKATDLPGGVTVQRRRRVVQIGKKEACREVTR
jgi:tRNA(Ile)-lysidine synthase